MLLCDVDFHKCGILQCIFHLNYLVNLNLTKTCNEFCCSIHHISYIHYIMEYLAELFFIHSDLSLTPLLAIMVFLLHSNVGKFCAYRDKLECPCIAKDTSV